MLVNKVTKKFSQRYGNRRKVKFLLGRVTHLFREEASPISSDEIAAFGDFIAPWNGTREVRKIYRTFLRNFTKRRDTATPPEKSSRRLKRTIRERKKLHGRYLSIKIIGLKVETGAACNAIQPWMWHNLRSTFQLARGFTKRTPTRQHEARGEFAD